MPFMLTSRTRPTVRPAVVCRPSRSLATEPGHAAQHRSVVPHHLGRLGHVTDHLPAEPLQHVSVGTCDLSLGYPWRVGHDRSSCRSDSMAVNDMKTPGPLWM